MFYNCSTKKQRGIKNCDSRNVQEREIEALIQPYLINGEYRKLTKKYIDLLIEKENEKKATLYMNVNQDRINMIKEKIEMKSNKLSQLIDIFLDDDTEQGKQLFKSKKNKLTKEIQELESELNKLTINDKEREIKLRNMNEYIKILEQSYITIPNEISREDFINNYLYEIIVHEDGELELITYTHKGYQEINNLMN